MKTPENSLTRILIVDDDATDKEVFVEALASINTGHSIRTAKNMEELFSILSKQKLPHLIFLDINLPGINGLDGLRSLKAHSNYKHLPVIMYSVSDYAKDIEGAFAAGADYYMIKPYSVLNLRVSLKKIMSIDWRETQPTTPREEFVIDESFSAAGSYSFKDKSHQH